jgi:PQQ-dependent catabolism-associated CXXCW motif protein
MILRVGGVVISGMLALAGMASRCDAQAAAEPEHYRTNDYRAPTPATLKGARVITTAQAHAIWRAGAGAFVDAMPDVPHPANLPAGTIWRGKQRLNIPGSTWLADTGYGELSAAVEDYLRAGLEGITGGDHAKLLVIYCLRDCWMSWNVAKRAISWGYSNVAWYPDGTDGWQDAGLPLSEAVPAPQQGR